VVGCPLLPFSHIIFLILILSSPLPLPLSPSSKKIELLELERNVGIRWGLVELVGLVRIIKKGIGRIR
jgi:hypothetical protein